jgi:hypothetical protein
MESSSLPKWSVAVVVIYFIGKVCAQLMMDHFDEAAPVGADGGYSTTKELK